jgi:hypothetical protein
MHVSVETTPGPVIAINCPKCGAKGVPSVSLDQVETIALVVNHRTSWVTCGKCGTSLLCKVPTAELLGKSPEQLEQWIVRRQPPVHVFVGDQRDVVLVAGDWAGAGRAVFVAELAAARVAVGVPDCAAERAGRGRCVLCQSMEGPA